MGKDFIIEQEPSKARKETQQIEKYDSVANCHLMEFVLKFCDRFKYLNPDFVQKRYYTHSGLQAHPKAIESILLQCGYFKSEFADNLWTLEEAELYG